MKIILKTSDLETAYDALQEAIIREVNCMGLPECEAVGLIQRRTEEESLKMRRWFRYGTPVMVEIDTTAMTATLLDA